MRAWRFLLYALAALALASCARPSAPNPALWRIADADSEIWLFGAVHVLPPDLKWRSAALDAAFNGADEFITETDLSPSAQNALAALAVQHGMLPSGARLSDRTGSTLYARLTRLAAAQHQDPSNFTALRPWLAALQLSVGYATLKGQTSDAGVETVLGAEADAQHKRRTFLETGEQQIRTLSDLSPADELAFLTATIDQIEADDEGFAAIDTAWVRGDTQHLAQLLLPDLREAGPAAYAALITTRNRDFTAQIEHRLAGSGQSFIAVGAAHLVGEDGVIAQLRAHGVTVEGPKA